MKQNYMFSHILSFQFLKHVLGLRSFCCFVIMLCSVGTLHAAPIRVVDDTGYALSLEKPVTRMLALYGAFSELALALNVGHTLVGRTSADANIEALRHLPAVGTHMRPNTEIITSLKPQVIIQLLGRSEAASLGLGLRKLGMPVLLFRMESFADMYKVLHALGALTGTEEAAKTLEKEYIKRLGDTHRILLDVPRVRVFFEVRYPHLLAAGSNSIINEIILTAGGRNVISTEGKIIRINEEELLRLNPDAYIIQKGPMNPNPEPVQQRPHYAALQAVKNQRILQVEELMFSRPGPRAVDAVEQLARWLHPNVDFSIKLD